MPLRSAHNTVSFFWDCTRAKYDKMASIRSSADSSASCIWPLDLYQLAVIASSTWVIAGLQLLSEPSPLILMLLSQTVCANLSRSLCSSMLKTCPLGLRTTTSSKKSVISMPRYDSSSPAGALAPFFFLCVKECLAGIAIAAILLASKTRGVAGQNYIE